MFVPCRFEQIEFYYYGNIVEDSTCFRKLKTDFHLTLKKKKTRPRNYLLKSQKSYNTKEYIIISQIFEFQTFQHSLDQKPNSQN